MMEKVEKKIPDDSEGLRKAYLELKASEERYHKMIDEVQDYAIILLDEKGNVLNWNKGAEKIKLYTSKEIIGQNFSLFYLPEDQKTGLPTQLITEAALKGKAIHEGWRVRKDGTHFWGSTTITALHGENDQIIGFSKVTRDLTEKKLSDDQLRSSSEELKRKNEELKLSEERYHQMIAEVQDYAIVLLNEEGNVQNWNAGAEFIKGYTADEIIGKNFRIFYTKEDREDKLPDRLLNNAIETGKAVQEGWRVRKDGTRFWGSIVITALHNKSGKLIGFSKVTRDLTKKKEADDKLLQYTAELEAKNYELEQFAYIASHDLQEPLRKIQTFTEILRKNIHDENSVNKYFDKITTSAQRMAEMIKSVLNYSRLTKDGSEFTAVDLNIIVANVKTDFELLIEEKKAKIISDPLPVIKGIPLQLTQLFTNLVSNALKFTNTNPSIVIHSKTVTKEEVISNISLSGDSKYLLLTFSDNGIGFEQQYANKIFSMFQRLHGKQEYAGTGIGLALCKRIVENHNGYITATSELGKGSIFYVYLPLN